MHKSLRGSEDHSNRKNGMKEYSELREARVIEAYRVG